MSSLKSFLSDNETKVDLLNNEAIAKTIVDLLREQPERPITVGVHGDWGAGKSSILEMIEQALADEPKVLCLKFNGWRFQGFEDAKIALIEGIVTGLLEKRPEVKKAVEKVRAVFRRIDWLKVAKKGGGLAFTALTGVPSPDIIQSVTATAIGALQDPGKAGEGVGKAVEGLQALLKPQEESKNVPEEINEFRKAFDELLEEAGIEQLIVLIDDLDRCLPDTAIETLEAVRLFVFTPKTAFVVAADEAMIEYSVRKHFPDLPTSSGPQTYARNYLEKLIQIPFRIPPLGEGETRIYVALALAEATMGQDSQGFKRLLAYAREVLTRPWQGCVLEDSKVREALGDSTGDAAELVALSDRIGPVLARGTSGNPRQVKRFLNAVLLRERMAEARGFGADVKLPVVAKLMLAERFKTDFFDQLVLEAAADPAGKSKSLAELENSSSQEQQPVPPPRGNKVRLTAKASPATRADREASAWSQDEWVTSWIEIEPKLASVDLRPYIFVANQQARMSLGSALGPLINTVNDLMGGRMAVVRIATEIGGLTIMEARSIMQELARRIRNAELSSQPPGIEGMKVLLKGHPELRTDAVEFLRFLPQEDLGPWVTSGWHEALGGQEQQLLKEWAEQTANLPLKTAAAASINPAS